MGTQIKKSPTRDEFLYVTFVEAHFHSHKLFPSPVVCVKSLPYSLEEIDKFNKSETVVTMLSNRGIEVLASDRESLTPDQIAAANCYLNIADTRPLTQKLKELGISPTRFSGWMKGKNFSRYIQERAEELFEDGMPFAHRELMAKVMNGDIKAIRLYYEVSGRYTGVQSVEAQNVTMILQRLLEAIQMEVSDPETVRRIGQRFQFIVNGDAQPIPPASQAIPAIPVSAVPPVEKPVSPVQAYAQKLKEKHDTQHSSLKDAF